MATTGNVPKPGATVTKTSKFLKGLIGGSLATLVLCTAATYFYFKDEINKRNKFKRAFEICKYGFPQRTPSVMYYSNYLLSYDPGRRTPIWVAEHLTRDVIEGSANRRQSRFQPDPEVDSIFSSSNDDYWNSGWSRGHMAPAADNKQTQESMNDSFYLTNVVPQDIENNTGFWNRFEIYCRDLTRKFSDVRIVSGPLYLPSVDEANKKKYVKYEVIGENNVAVPTHLYKIVLAEHSEQSSDPKKVLGAFIVPNVPLGTDRELTEFQVPLETLEKQVGVKFFKNLDRYQVSDLCKVDKCKLLSKLEFSRYYLSRKLSGARTPRRLEKIWEEVQVHGLLPDAQLQLAYEKKKEELGLGECSSTEAKAG